MNEKTVVCKSCGEESDAVLKGQNVREWNIYDIASGEYIDTRAADTDDTFGVFCYRCEAEFDAETRALIDEALND